MFSVGNPVLLCYVTVTSVDIMRHRLTEKQFSQVMQIPYTVQLNRQGNYSGITV